MELTKFQIQHANLYQQKHPLGLHKSKVFLNLVWEDRGEGANPK